MIKSNMYQVKEMEFPTGRCTRVIVGKDSEIEAKHFVQGFVTIYPEGYIPSHKHNEEETYTILSGKGEMTVEGESKIVHEGDIVYIPSGQSHMLKNVGDKDLLMMFVYSPKVIAEHWQLELEGKLK